MPSCGSRTSSAPTRSTCRSRSCPTSPRCRGRSASRCSRCRSTWSARAARGPESSRSSRDDPRMTDNGYAALRVAIDRGIARVTIDHPPLNLLDATLLDNLDAAGRALAADDGVRVVVVDSADREFFIAHADVRGMIGRGDARAERRERLSRFAEMTERWRTMPKATIAVIMGRARGGGSEFALALDMRFAARETAVLSQPEVGLGIPPGGGATQRLPRLCSRGRALEVILGAEDFDADTAERYGWVNRSLPAAALHAFVDRLAVRIAGFPAPAVAAAKAAVDAGEAPAADGLREEHRLLRRALATSEATAAMEGFLAAGGQTREYEVDLGRPTGRPPRVTLRERLVGSWLLESYEARDPDGTVHEPFGPDPVGLLVYGADGRMAVQAMDPLRPPWARHAPDDQRRAERAAAADGYIAYAGRFEVEEGAEPFVVHHVETSLVPNWVGRPQRRAVVLDGDRLQLTAPAIDVGGRWDVPVLTWRRSAAALFPPLGRAGS